MYILYTCMVHIVKKKKKEIPEILLKERKILTMCFKAKCNQCVNQYVTGHQSRNGLNKYKFNSFFLNLSVLTLGLPPYGPRHLFELQPSNQRNEQRQEGLLVLRSHTTLVLLSLRLGLSHVPHVAARGAVSTAKIQGLCYSSRGENR